MGALLILGRAYWKELAIALVLLSLLGAVKHYKNAAEECQEKNRLLQVAQDSLMRDNQRMAKDIESQNVAVETMRTVAEQKAKEAKDAIAKAAAVSIVAKRDASDLMKRTKPAGTSACDAAASLFESEVRK